MWVYVFWSALEKKMLVYFMVIWYIIEPFGKVWGHFVYLSRFGMFYQEKSGNPVDLCSRYT
jgi:hypothetical protein